MLLVYFSLSLVVIWFYLLFFSVYSRFSVLLTFNGSSVSVAMFFRETPSLSSNFNFNILFYYSR